MSSGWYVVSQDTHFRIKSGMLITNFQLRMTIPCWQFVAWSSARDGKEPLVTKLLCVGTSVLYEHFIEHRRSPMNTEKSMPVSVTMSFLSQNKQYVIQKLQFVTWIPHIKRMNTDSSMTVKNRRSSFLILRSICSIRPFGCTSFCLSRK